MKISFEQRIESYGDWRMREPAISEDSRFAPREYFRNCPDGVVLSEPGLSQRRHPAG
jgi:Pyruvate/2-oxoacid:ferredoxin oxidoreductase delta subunit